MHFRLFVTLNVTKTMDNKEIEEIVTDELSNDSSFLANEDNAYRVFSPICDWFVIGGRWEGFFGGSNVKLITQDIYDKHLKAFENLRLEFEDDDLFFIDLNEDNVDESFIGKKAIVIVDYHS